MWRERTVVLGLPLDLLTLNAAVEAVFALAEDYRRDGRPRLVVTINVDFVVNAHGWFASVHRHPELLRILREADLATADGMPLVWASRLLGCALPTRVTGADLVPALATAAATRQASLYFLGGRPEVTEAAAQLLLEANPGLRIAAVDAPFVYTEGGKLASAYEEDTPICERINAAHPDFLLVAFGNPKQELWFRRNRHRLKVPVTIGIGGTFNFITGAISRAPWWMQHSGLEWVYRMAQEPRRLWRRYAVGMAKIAWLLAPTLLADRLPTRFSRRRRQAPEAPPIFFSEGTRLRVQPVPAEEAPGVAAELGARLLADPPEVLVLDVSHIRSVSSAAVAFVAECRRQLSPLGTEVWVYGIRPAFRRQLIRSRAWDLLRDGVLEHLTHAVPRAAGSAEAGRCMLGIDAVGQAVVVAVYGELYTDRLGDLDRSALAAAITRRDCIVDLGYCADMDGAGTGFLMRLREVTEAGGGQFILCRPCPAVRQILRINRVSGAGQIAVDLAQARNLLATARV